MHKGTWMHDNTTREIEGEVENNSIVYIRVEKRLVETKDKNVK